MGATGGFLQQWRETQRTRQWSKALELAVTEESGKYVKLGNECHGGLGGERRFFSEKRSGERGKRCLGTVERTLDSMERQEGNRLW